MNDPRNDLKQSARQVRLSRTAFERIRAELVAHMNAHPAAMPSPYVRLLALKRSAAAFVLIALISAGGATAYAAHGALPGDPLYPLKVKVIEPVQGLLAVTPKAKTAWKASIASERLLEAAQLAAKEKLTPEAAEKSDERFSKTLREAQESIRDLSKKDPQAAADIKTSLAHSLDEHQAVLSSFGAASSLNAKEARKIAGHAKAEIESTLIGALSTTTEGANPLEGNLFPNGKEHGKERGGD